MNPVTILVREQMRLMKPILTSKNVLAAARIAQDKAGELGARSNAGRVRFENVDFADFSCAWAIPDNEPSNNKVVLYLHGGGYTAGGIEYARGFGSVLAAETGRKVLCVAYRLAPEVKFPAALDDSVCAYKYLLTLVNSPRDIVFAGESAGGGLCYALIHRLKELKLPLPAGVAAISPWADLSQSGPSHTENAENDPGMSKELLDFYAACYLGSHSALDPLASPVWGDLSGFPKSLIIASQNEVLLSDSELLARSLSKNGSEVNLIVFRGMWHAFVLYGVPEAQKAVGLIKDFIGEF